MTVTHAGGFGVDFSRLRPGGVVEGVASVAKGLLAHGVTAFCPTIITSASDYYASVSTGCWYNTLNITTVLCPDSALPPSAVS